MEIGEKNVLEQRRAKWTTYTNLNMWFNTWEGVLIELGFSRLKREGEYCEGFIVFFDGHKYRIINLDETGSDISCKSATMMVLQGRIGESPKTKG